MVGTTDNRDLQMEQWWNPWRNTHHLFPQFQLDLVTHTWNPSSQEAEQEHLHELASLDYIEKP